MLQFTLTVTHSFQFTSLAPNQSQDGSIAERLSQQHDTSSVASSRASLNPNYDEASLNLRNVIASKPHLSTADKKRHGGRRGSSLSNNSQGRMPQHETVGLYASVDVATDSFPTKPVNQEAGRSVTSRSLSSDNDDQRVEGDGCDDLPVGDGPDYAVLEEAEKECAPHSPSNNEAESHDQNSPRDEISGSPDYAVVEPPLPDPPVDNSSADSREQTPHNPLPTMAENDGQFDDEHASGPESALEEESVEERYVPLLPPRHSPAVVVEDGHNVLEVRPQSDDRTADGLQKTLKSRAVS